MKGTRPLTNDLCGQYFKVKVKVNLFISAKPKPPSYIIPVPLAPPP